MQIRAAHCRAGLSFNVAVLVPEDSLELGQVSWKCLVVLKSSIRLRSTRRSLVS